MLGAGIYLDDVERAAAQVRERARGNARSTLLALGAVALVAVLLVFAGGLALNVSGTPAGRQQAQSHGPAHCAIAGKTSARGCRASCTTAFAVIGVGGFSLNWPSTSWTTATSAPATACARAWAGWVRRWRGATDFARPAPPRCWTPHQLAAALDQLSREFAQRTGIAVQQHTDHEMTALNRQPAKTVALFRIAQEGLCNIERHAHASQVDIPALPPRQPGGADADRQRTAAARRMRCTPAPALPAQYPRAREHLAGDFPRTNPSLGRTVLRDAACPGTRGLLL